MCAKFNNGKYITFRSNIKEVKNIAERISIITNNF